MSPFLGRELAKMRTQELRLAAERQRRVRWARRHRRWSARSGGALRLALGIRLVGAGFRLLGQTVEPLG